MWRRKAVIAVVAVVAATAGTVVALPAATVSGPATTQQPAQRLRQPISGSEPLCAARPGIDAWVSTSVRLHQFDMNAADDPTVEITDTIRGFEKPVSDQFITSAFCDELLFPKDHSYNSQNERINGFGLVDVGTGKYEFVPTDYEYGEIFPTIWGFVEVVVSDGIVDVLDIFDVEDVLISSFDIPSGYRVADVSLDGYSISLVPTDLTPASPFRQVHRDPLLVMHAERATPFLISDCLGLRSQAEFSPSGNAIQFESPCGEAADEQLQPGPYALTRVHVANAWTGVSRTIDVRMGVGIERRLLTDDRIVLCGNDLFGWTVGSSTAVTVLQQRPGNSYEGWMCAAVR